MRRLVALLWCLCALATACSSSTNIDISDSFTPRPTATPRVDDGGEDTGASDDGGDTGASEDVSEDAGEDSADEDSAEAWEDDTQPGAAGFGDAYFPALGNGGYDVAHYTVRLSWNQAERHLDGQAEITAVATEDLTSFHLDLAGLSVSSVAVNGAEAHYDQEGDELIVLPETPLDAGDGFIAIIGYGGEPAPLDPIAGVPVSGWMTTADAAYVVSEPAGAATWFPVNDHPGDKATYRFEVTVPDGTEVAANGLLVDAVTAGSTTTWVYDAPDPQAPYLSTVVIGDLELIDAGKADGDGDEPVTVRHAIATSIAGEIADFDDTPRMIEVLSDLFGPYPFVAYGVVVVDDSFGAALETQTMSIFGSDFVLGGANIEIVAVHELAHQWFGNDVSLARWQDIWLNEGFASYAELLWLEATDAAFDIDAAAEARRQRSEPGVPVGDPGPDRLFSSAVYQGGAATLHALRRTVGDPAFFAVLQEWVSRYGGGNATTEDFVALAEEISGQELTEFFDAWLFSTELPPLPQ